MGGKWFSGIKTGPVGSERDNLHLVYWERDAATRSEGERVYNWMNAWEDSKRCQDISRQKKLHVGESGRENAMFFKELKEVSLSPITMEKQTGMRPHRAIQATWKN